MKRYDLYILDSTKAVVASMQDAAWEISETLNVEDSLRAVLYEADKFSLVTAENTFIRLVNAEDSTDKRTYRLTSVEQSRIEGRHALQCEGARIWADMGREIYEGWHPFKNIQVKTIVAELLGSSAFQIKSGGAAESDTTIVESLDFAYTTVLEGLQRIAEANDLEIEIDESTSPESIDLKTRGANNNARFEYGINTKGMARRFRRAEVVNKAYPVGGGTPPATCEGALFEVYGTAAAVVTVAGDKCIPSDDTYNTYKIEMVTGANAGTAYTINDTTRGSSGNDDTITLSATPTGVVAGDLFKFTDASGNDLAYVPDAASQAAYGTFDGVVRDAQFEEIRTLITPGYMDGTYASGLHDGWTKTGTPTVAEETTIDFIQHGKASQKVTAASDTHGIYNDVALDSSAYYSCAVNLYVASGSVLVTISTTGNGAVSYTNQGGTSGTGWLTVELEGLPIEGATATLTVAATGGAATFYVDAVSFTGTQQTRQFVRENGARELYRMAFDYLDENDAPLVEYDLPNALDLYAIDARAYPFADVAIGDTVTVIDPAMSLAASVRVLSLGRDSNGTQLRLKLASHTSTEAAFSLVAPGAGRVIQTNRKTAQDVIDANRTNETATSIAQRINRMTGNGARASRFTGDFTATGQTSFDVGAGTLYMGASLQYTINAQTISGLSGSTVYYLYFDPTAASSGLQTTTTAATAYATNNIQVGVLQTGASANDNVQIYDTTGAIVSAELVTRGLEAYDTSGNKRIDIGIIDDPSAAIGNPGTWGVQVTDGTHQTTSLLPEYTGLIPGAVRYVYATFGDEDDDLTFNTTTQKVYGDYVSMYAKSSADMIIGLYEGSLVSGSSGDLYGHQISSLLNSGSGNATALNIGVTQAAGGGHAYGVHVGSGLGVRSTSSGNAYGIYIGTVSSTSGTAYSIYDATTNRARFGGSISIRGVDYVWPAADGTATYQLATDGAGNLSWAAPTGGAVTGSGTTNYIPKWTGSTALGDSIALDDGTSLLVGADKAFSPRYDGSNSYRGNFQWQGIQFGNNGDNYIVAGNTLTGGGLIFAVNNTVDLATDPSSHDGTNMMWVNTNGVGVGVNSTSGWYLSVASNAANNLMLAGRDNVGTDEATLGFYQYNKTTQHGYIQGRSGLLAFADNTGEVVYVGGGYFGVGTNNPEAPVEINLAPISEGTALGQLLLNSVASYNSSPQSGVIFKNRYDSGNSEAYMGSIRVGKENSTDGNYAGFMAFDVRAHGAVAFEAGRISSAGNWGLGITPTHHLHLYGNSQQVKIEASTSTSSVYSGWHNGTGVGYIGIDSSSGGAIATGGTAYGFTVSSSASGVPLEFAAAGSVGLRLDHNLESTITNYGKWLYGVQSGSSSTVSLIRSIGMGYSQATYSGIQVGQEGNHIALFIDPSSILSGAFGGGSEIMIPSSINWIQEDSAGTGWINPMMVWLEGNVGIGVSPSYKLDVNGTLHATGAVTFDSTLTVSGASIVSGTGTADRLVKFSGTSTVANSIIYESATSIGINKSPIGQLQVHDTSAALVAYFTTDGLNDTTLLMGTDFDGTPRNGVIGVDYSASQVVIGYGSSLASAAIRIDSSQNVGIGMAPVNTLDVTGSFGATGAGQFGGTLTVQSASPSLHLADTGAVGQNTLIFYSSTSTVEASVVLDMTTGWMSIGTTTSKPFYINTNSTTAVTVDTNQRVGINDTSPDSQLHIHYNGISTANGVRLENDAGRNWLLGEVVTNGVFAIYDNGATDSRVVIHTDGDVGIGTSTPSGRFHAAKNDASSSVFIGQFENSKTTTTNASGILGLTFSQVDPNDANHTFLWCVGNGTNRAYLDASGSYYGDGTYGTISDIRLKHDIQPARSYWDDFKSLQYKTYKMIDGGEQATNRFGLIAQDVEAVFSRLVTIKPDGYKAVKSSIIGEIGNSVLIEAQKRIEQLETEKAELAARVEALEAA